MVQRDLSANELDWIVGQSTHSPPWVAVAYCAAGMFSNYLPEAEEVDRSIRVLYVVAEGSGDRAKAYLDAQLPNAQVASLGGYFMFWEYPEKFNAILEGYLEQLD
jgi:hypothetical protein